MVRATKPRPSAPANDDRPRRRAPPKVALLAPGQRIAPPSVEELWACCWFVLYAGPGQERVALKALRGAGFAVYLPVETSWNRTRFRTKRQLERPLLTRYLFVGVPSPAGRSRRLTDAELSRLLNVDGVHGVLGQGGSPLGCRWSTWWSGRASRRQARSIRRSRAPSPPASPW